MRTTSLWGLTVHSNRVGQWERQDHWWDCKGQYVRVGWVRGTVSKLHTILGCHSGSYSRNENTKEQKGKRTLKRFLKMKENDYNY